MQQTNSALCSGGIHQHFFRCGLISFFLVSVARSRRRSTPHTQQAQGPASATGRGRATGHSQETGFQFAIEKAAGRPRRHRARRQRFHPVLDETFPHPLHRRAADVQSSTDLLIGPTQTPSARIRLQEDAAIGLPLGAGAASRYQLLQARSLVRTELPMGLWRTREDETVMRWSCDRRHRGRFALVPRARD